MTDVGRASCRDMAARAEAGVLEVVKLAAREGGLAKVVWLDVDHAVHVSPVRRWDGAGAVYFGPVPRDKQEWPLSSRESPPGNSGHARAAARMLSVRDGRLCLDGVDLTTLADR